MCVGTARAGRRMAAYAVGLNPLAGIMCVGTLITVQPGTTHLLVSIPLRGLDALRPQFREFQGTSFLSLNPLAGIRCTQTRGGAVTHMLNVGLNPLAGIRCTQTIFCVERTRRRFRLNPLAGIRCTQT